MTESERLFKAFSKASLAGIYIIQDDTFTFVNDCFADIFGYKASEIIDTLGPLDLTHPEDRRWVAKNLHKRVNGTVKTMQFDFRCRTRQEKTIHVEVCGTNIEYDGKPAITGTILDITPNKKTVERYHASVESFEALFDSISDAIYIQNTERKFIKVNEAAVQLSGYSRDVLVGKKPEALAAPGKVDLEKRRRLFQKALDGDTQRFEQWGRRKGGEIFPEKVILNPATYYGEDVVIAISKDISEQHEVQQEIVESREKFSELFKNAPVGIVLMDKHEEIRTFNKAFENIFGYKEYEIEGLNVDRVIVPEGKENDASKISSEIYHGKASSTTARRIKKDGSAVDVLIYGVPVKVDGKTIAIFGIYADISERKAAEEKLRASLREKEVLLAEIHHRVKNNLAVITGLIELQQYNTESEVAKDILRESQLRIQSIALIHEKLYQNKDLSEISLETYLTELIEIIVSSMGSDETTVNISVDSDVINLTINQAIPCGLILNELITNSYQHAFKGRREGGIHIKLCKDSGQITLNYGDDGRGFPSDFDLDSPDSLGITLIKTLSKQLEGDYKFNEKKKGMQFKLAFKMDA